MSDSLIIAGPEHPDLFGGTTPIMLELAGGVRAFEVSVIWKEYHQEHVVVAAANSEEARNIAIDRMESMASSHEEDFDAEEVTTLSRTVSAKELKAYKQSTGGK